MGKGKAEPLEQRWLAKVNKTDSCWLWTASVDYRGYGKIGIDSSKWDRAHRVAYRLFKGEIPPGHLVMHSCDNPRCVNPEHLSIGTDADNNADMRAKGRHVVPAGERNGNAKLTSDQALEIRAAQGRTLELARHYNVGISTIKNIKSGKSWIAIHG